MIDTMLGLNVNRTGFLHYSWVAVGIPLILIFVLLYLKFLAHLPRKTRLLFFVAGTIGQPCRANWQKPQLMETAPGSLAVFRPQELFQYRSLLTQLNYKTILPKYL